MADRLTDKVAIVTGAAGGIGLAYAKALAGEGAKVAIADVEDCAPAAAEIERAYQGAEVLALRTDVSDEAACRDMVAAAVRRFGRLDILVNNAALFAKIPLGPFEDIKVEDWDRVMAVNVRGPFLCAKAAVPEMRKRKYGKIINISSGVVFKGPPAFLHYVSSKGAVLAMTRALSREVGGDNICVNALAPGLTMSDAVVGMTDEGFVSRGHATVESRALKRAEVPEDLVGAMLFLASPDSDFMTGQCLVVDGGSVNH